MGNEWRDDMMGSDGSDPADHKTDKIMEILSTKIQAEPWLIGPGSTPRFCEGRF